MEIATRFFKQFRMGSYTMGKSSQKRRKSRVNSIAMHTALEPRKMLAGDVGVSLADGALTFTGSFGADSVQIVQEGDSVAISGLDGTTINGGSGPFVVESGAQDLSYRGALRGGDDAVTIQGLDTSGSVRIFGANGNDTIDVQDSQVDGVFAAFGGRGNDDISISDVEVGRVQVLNGGTGGDTLTLAGDNSAVRERVLNFEESVIVEEAPEDEESDDEVVSNVIGVTVDGGNVTLTGTSGDDGIIVHRVPEGIQILLSRVTGNVFEDGSTSRRIDLGTDGLDSLTIELGEGNDGVFLSGIEADNLTIDGGSGVDSTVIRASSFDASDFENLEVVR